MEAGDIVTARLTPLRTDDLVPAAAALVGQVLQFTATWIVDDGFPYEGQWRMALSDADRVPGELRWVPECDLSEVVKIGEDPEYAWTKGFSA